MSRSLNDLGFTLVELLVVMAIMALLAVLLVPQLSRRGPSTERQADRVMSALLSGRSAALRDGATRQVDLLSLASDARWSPSYPLGTSGPAFEADGAANGGRVILADGREITISWIDGDVRKTP